MDRNIFEAVSKKLRKQFNKNSTPGNNRSFPADRKDLESDPIQMVELIECMKEDLDAKLKDLHEKGNRYHLDIDKYVDKLQKMYPHDFENIQREHQKMRDQINGLFPPEACIKKNAKGVDKLTQERKGKTLGLRKKWIPMK